MTRENKNQTDLRTPIYLGYDQIAAEVEKFVPKVMSQQYDAMIIVLRGGSFPGMHLAFLTNIPVYFINYHRPTRTVSWHGEMPEANAKVLLVEDFAGSGTTLTDSIAFLEGNYQIETFVVCKDQISRLQNPDYFCFNLEDRNSRFILPWEKHEYENNLN